MTGSRIAPPPSITNNQTAGVDEGDIVKRVGDRLVVLQDGRLFVVGLRDPDGAAGLRLDARQDVYRSALEDTWYDEILTFGRRIVVTGYSYDQEATEFSVFTLEDDGALVREAVFYMTSDDYYDVDNYATRLVDDTLVIYTPIALADSYRLEPPVAPAVRRWRAEPKDAKRPRDEHALFDTRRIYRPVQRTTRPVIHSFSFCPLNAAARGDFDCRTTAIVGPGSSAFFVAPDAVWLWLGPDWDDYPDPAPGAPWCARWNYPEAAPTAAYRIPVTGRRPTALFARGEPVDQFSFDADAETLRMLLVTARDGCNDAAPLELAYFSAPIRRFRAAPRTAPDDFFTPLLAPDGGVIENRFTETHLVYAGRRNWSSYPPEPDEPDVTARVAVAPVADPAHAVTLVAPHGVARVERAGPYAALTGYRNNLGLSVSIATLSAEPRIADTRVLKGRYESEGRSHAFNSMVDANGAGLLGIPTVTVEDDAGRWWWWSDTSDVSFLTVGAEARLHDAGPLVARALAPEDDPNSAYECEVSCVDWYGNARPIFIDDRVLALTGTELIEGALIDGRIEEIRRLDLTAPLTAPDSPPS